MTLKNCGGERDGEALIEGVRAGMRNVNIDYVALVDAETMQPVREPIRPVVLAVAALLPTARLIDNIKFDPNAAVENGDTSLENEPEQ